MPTQNSNEFQILLDAEEKANQIVTEGREYRAQRIKDAKKEAAKEIESLIAENEALLRRRQEELHEMIEDHKAKVNKDSKNEVESIRFCFGNKRKELVRQLVECVKNVFIHINPNSGIK